MATSNVSFRAVFPHKCRMSRWGPSASGQVRMVTVNVNVTQISVITSWSVLLVKRSSAKPHQINMPTHTVKSRVMSI